MGLGVVTTKYGKLAGTESTEMKYAGVTYFKGVPYAKPPVGELRWKAPQEPECWDGVRVCDMQVPRCPQMVMEGLAFDPYDKDFYYNPNPEMSEDCLYLNITTPAMSAGEKLPVYMWFHGGGLSSGFNSEVEFEASELARKGVITVSVNQRLNIMGYLCLPQLREEAGTCGNYGLMDEVAALKWVYENIAGFGGDPENITIGGQSGGTWKTGALAASPMQKGMVKRVINQSSLCWLMKYKTMEEQEKDDMAFLESIGINPNASLEELRALPFEVFYKIDFSKPFGVGPMLPGNMVCDGKYVPYTDGVKAFLEYASDCDYLTGSNYGECAMRKGFILGGKNIETAEEFYEILKDWSPELYEKYDLRNLISVTDATAEDTSKMLGVRGLTGFGGEMEYRYFGAFRKAIGKSAKTFSYIFSHITPDRPEDKGTARDKNVLKAWHSSELWYTFGSLRENVPPCRPWTETDYRLRDQMTSYWANFIATGDPNVAGAACKYDCAYTLPVWPESDESYSYMELGDIPTPHIGLEGALDEYLLEAVKATRENLPEA